jgi:hypothetical protein
VDGFKCNALALFAFSCTLAYKINDFLLLSMLSIRRQAMARFMRTTVLVSVLAGLCFSVGEGLRLRPFPISSMAGSGVATAESHFQASQDSVSARYGPVYTPARVQNRNKREAVDYAYLPGRSNHVLTAYGIFFFALDETNRVASASFASSPSGRAPPSSVTPTPHEFHLRNL